MKRMTLPAILAAAVLAFALAGCSQAQSVNEDTLKGTWALESGSNLGFEAYIDFEDDSVAELIVADSYLEGTWAVSGSEVTLEIGNGMEVEPEMEDFAEVTEDEESDGANQGVKDEGDGEAEAETTVEPESTTAKLTFSNNKLTLGSADGSKLVFVKDDSEETKSMFAFDYDPESFDFDSEEDAIEYVDEKIDPVDPAVTIADDDKFSVAVTGKGTDITGDPCYALTITNKTDKDVFITSEDDFTVGGKAIEAGLGDEIPAGETVEVQMYFAQDDLGGALEALTTTDGVIQMIDDENDDVIASYAFHME